MDASPDALSLLLTTFFTIFFLGASVSALGSAFETEDSIWAAVDALGFTPIWESETGGVGTSGVWTERRESEGGAACEGESVGGVGDVTVGVRSSLAMMACARAAASSSSLSGVGSGSAAAGRSSSLPAGLRLSSATQPITRRYTLSFVRCGVSRSH